MRSYSLGELCWVQNTDEFISHDVFHIRTCLLYHKTSFHRIRTCSRNSCNHFNGFLYIPIQVFTRLRRKCRIRWMYFSSLLVLCCPTWSGESIGCLQLQNDILLFCAFKIICLHKYSDRVRGKNRSISNRSYNIRLLTKIPKTRE